MTYLGRIENGVAVLDQPMALPDGTRVRVGIEPDKSDFWGCKTVEDLAREQNVKCVSNIADLVIDWPREESADELMSLVREVRH